MENEKVGIPALPWALYLAPGTLYLYTGKFKQFTGFRGVMAGTRCMFDELVRNADRKSVSVFNYSRGKTFGFCLFFLLPLAVVLFLYSF
jgi:hypothetical protein